MYKKLIRMTVAAAATLATAQPAVADTVSDWMTFVIHTNNPVDPPAGTPPRPDTARATSRAALAMFEALNAIDRRYESYLGMAAADPSASQDAAAATAAYQVMIDHFPNLRSELDDNYAIAMAAIPNDAHRETGRLIGEKAAKAALAVGGIDAAIKQTPYRPRTKLGEWVATALPSVKPHDSAFHLWAVARADALRPPPPPAFTSERWARDYNEVKRLGGRISTDRTPHQTLMANYRIMPDIAPALRMAAESPGRSPVQNARMYARVYMATDDGGVAMADAKMFYDSWRPITAIRNGADDGSDATAADPMWLPLLGTPNFPEHPCGHCIYAGAIAEVMAAEVGESPVTGVRVGTLASPNAVVQVLPSWAEWAKQVNDSRIYAGAHFRFANEAGEQMGRGAARAVLENVMRPLSPKKAP